MSNLDGKHITDLVLTSPTVQLKMTPHDQEISLSFSGEGVSGNRSVTVLRSTATEMALYFLKNEGLPSE